MIKPPSTWGDFNRIDFIIQQALAKLQTATLVEIISCTNNGGLSAFGFVDVQPLVNQIDGSTPPNATPHATVYGLPYMRIQGGSNAVIMDPKPGDIGIAVFANRDISKVKSTQEQANPGSYRTFDFADGMYIGGVLNGTPLQYIQFSETGITIVSPTKITLQAPAIDLSGAVSMGGASGATATMTGAITATGDVTGNGISLHSHVHTSAAPGSPTSEPLP